MFSLPHSTRDIQEIQKKNQELLYAVRELTQRSEEDELRQQQKIIEEVCSHFASLLSCEVNAELQSLHEARRIESEHMAIVLKQNNLYRTLFVDQTSMNMNLQISFLICRI